MYPGMQDLIRAYMQNPNDNHLEPLIGWCKPVLLFVHSHRLLQCLTHLYSFLQPCTIGCFFCFGGGATHYIFVTKAPLACQDTSCLLRIITDCSMITNTVNNRLDGFVNSYASLLLANTFVHWIIPNATKSHDRSSFTVSTMCDSVYTQLSVTTWLSWHAQANLIPGCEKRVLKMCKTMFDDALNHVSIPGCA